MRNLEEAKPLNTIYQPEPVPNKKKNFYLHKILCVSVTNRSRKDLKTSIDMDHTTSLELE